MITSTSTTTTTTTTTTPAAAAAATTTTTKRTINLKLMNGPNGKMNVVKFLNNIANNVILQHSVFVLSHFFAKDLI